MKYLVFILLGIFVISCSPKYEKIPGEIKLLDSKPSNNPNDCINSFRKIEQQLGKIRNYDSEKMSLSQTIDRYVNRLNLIDKTGCPEQFLSTLEKHTKSWIALKKVTNKYQPLRGEIHYLFDILKSEKDSSEFKLLEQKVWEEF